MPKDKDFKRLVRTRMQKTGESYTAARAVLLERRDPPPASYAELAGMSDDAVRKRTGRGWAEWVAELDRVEAVTMLHRDIARYVSSHYDISDWWAQTVTVSYERIRGLRAPGQRRDGMKGGGFDVNKSKTLHVPVSDVYRMFSDAARRDAWLGNPDITPRTSHEDKSFRALWRDQAGETAVDVYFYPKGERKTTVSVQHRKLPDQESADRARALLDRASSRTACPLG